MPPLALIVIHGDLGLGFYKGTFADVKGYMVGVGVRVGVRVGVGKTFLLAIEFFFQNGGSLLWSIGNAD